MTLKELLESIENGFYMSHDVATLIADHGDLKILIEKDGEEEYIGSVTQTQAEIILHIK